jgi:hypothetical protein
MFMFGELIRILIAAACGLFVLSLPVSATGIGSTLRRAAGVCLVLALLPALLHGLFFAPTAGDLGVGTADSPDSSTTSSFFTNLGCLTAAVLASLGAYWILRWQSNRRASSKPRDPWESFFDRGGSKRPFTMHSNASRTRGPFNSYDDEDGD